MAVADATVTAPRPGWLRHAAAVVVGFALLFSWIFAQPLFGGRLLAESDLFDQYLPLFRAPMLVWSSYEFAGAPAFADPENSAFYPVRFLFAHVLHSWNGFIVCAYVLAGGFAYAYLFAQTRSRAAAAFGGIGFALSEALIERVPHANVLHAVVWVPLLLLAIDRLRRSRAWAWWTAVAALAGAACILAGHPQFAVYSAYVCGAYALAGLVAERAPVRHWVRTAAAAAIALLVSAVSLVPLAELSRHSLRQTVAFTDFVDYTNTPWQMLSSLFPVISHPGLEAPTYVGLAVVLGAALGAWQLRSDWRVGFWLIVGLGGLALGAGDATPLARLLYELPLYDRFRIVSRHLVFAAWALNVLAAYGVAALLQRRLPGRALAVAGALFVVLLGGGAVLLGTHPDAVRFDHVNEASAWPWLVDDVWRQLLIAAATLVAVIGVWRHPGSRLAPAFLIALLGVDLVRSSSYGWTATGLSMVTVDPAAATPGVHARALAAELAVSSQRFLSVPDSLRDPIVPGEFARTWQIPSAGGYTSLLLQDVAAMALLSPNGRVDRAALADDDVALDLLAVRYVLAGEGAAPAVDQPRWHTVSRVMTSRTTDRTADEEAADEHAVTILENRRALPRAWLASEVLPTTDGVMSDAIRTSRLRGGRRFEPAATALVFEGALPARRYEPGGTARVTDVRDSRITVDVSSGGGGFLVLSEAYYPGWQARIDDGPAAPVHRTDLALQGTPVPAGRHLVTFEFTSRARRLGLGLAAAGTLALVGLFIAGWRTSPL